MRVFFLSFFVLAIVGLPSRDAAAQEAQRAPRTSASSQDVTTSTTEDAVNAPRPSLDRIRERLAEASPVQESLGKQPTFRIQIDEARRRFLELVHTLEVEVTDKRPPPPGGVYGYETQRIAMAALDRDRMEPYAAFSGPEFLTLAIEGLVGKYLGGRTLNAVTDSERARAEAAAREEASRTVRQYCAAQPEYGAGVRICSDSTQP